MPPKRFIYTRTQFLADVKVFDPCQEGLRALRHLLKTHTVRQVYEACAAARHETYKSERQQDLLTLLRWIIGVTRFYSGPAATRIRTALEAYGEGAF